MDVYCAVSIYIIAAVSTVQTMIYPRDPPKTSTMVFWPLLMLVYLLGGFAQGWLDLPMCDYLSITWMTYSALGKALSTFQKYFMQALHNYELKSVTGVSITTCMLDLTGCVLGLWQMQLDSWIYEEGFFIVSPRFNLAKFLLLLFAGSFDIIILTQYYFLYYENS